MKLIKILPLPMAAVMFGVAALGSLLEIYSEAAYNICSISAIFLAILILLKMILFQGIVREELKRSTIASIMCTYPMGLMLLSVYLKPFIGSGATFLWFFSIGIHIGMIINFTVKFMVRLDMKKVFASHFVVYVGLAVASITAPAYDMELLGTFIFWFAFVYLILLLVLVTTRHLRHRHIPEPMQSLYCIYAAPASLCLSGYILSVTPQSLGMIAFLAILSTVIYIIVLASLPKLMMLKFYTSTASFTFPFVVSAMAMEQTRSALEAMGYAVGWLKYVVLLETIIATVLVAYTLARYTVYIYQKSGHEESEDKRAGEKLLP